MQQPTAACAVLCKSAVLALGLLFSIAYSADAEDVRVTDQSFGCIRDGFKVRNTYIRNADPEKLKEAIHIFEGREPNRSYPVGTFLQLLPSSVMVKHAKGEFPDTNGWEFFTLTLSPGGTRIRLRGDKIANGAGVACISCHRRAAKFDYVCEKGHGCDPISLLDDRKIAQLQGRDPRCLAKRGPTPGQDAR